MMTNPNVESFFDPQTYTVTHVVWEKSGGQCAIIDPVLDYDPASGRTNTESADRVSTFLADHDLSVKYILETHVHADHLSGAPLLKSRHGGKIVIGKNVSNVQSVFGPIFDAEPGFATDGRQFDKLVQDGEEMLVDGLSIRVIHTPGHTPACVSYLIGDAVFIGDTLFMPDYGAARCDFPGGDAGTLYDSVQKLYALPDETRMFMCHDYKAPGRDEYAWETTVGAQKAGNVMLNAKTSREEFVAKREARDATLGMPTLILPSVQVNMRAGELPPASDNGTTYLKIPVDAL